MRITSKFSIVFGLVAAFSALATAWTVHRYLYGKLEQNIEQRMKSTAAFTAAAVDAEEFSKFEFPPDYFTDEYRRLKARFVRIQRTNRLSWVALYRHDGEVFRAIVDGAEEGDSLCPGFPVFDLTGTMLRAVKGEAGIVELYRDEYGLFLSTYSPVKDAAGRIAGIVDVSLSGDKLLEAKQAVRLRTVAITLLAAILAIFVCYFVTLSLTGPIKRLERGARELADGNLDHRVAVRSNDEIGYLTKTFNAMAESLDRRVHELIALNEVSRQLSFAPSLELVIETVLERVMRTVNSSAASLLLIEGSGNLVLKHRIETGGSKLDSCEALLGPQGVIPGKVIATGRSFMSNAVEADPDLARSGAAGVRSVISVPMNVEGSAVGVINVVNRRGGDSFSEVDLEFIQTMANHVALTIEKIGLYEMAITDGLTRLYVHRYFQAALEKEISRSKRYGSEVSLLLFDIDHFKSFNDTYGHQQGDMVLATIAQIVSDSIRKGIDVPARYGGEEFAVILPETGAENARLTAERLRAKVEEFEFPGQDRPLRVTISIGVATCPGQAAAKEALIRCADVALYRAKQSGRNMTVVFSPEMESVTKDGD